MRRTALLLGCATAVLVIGAMSIGVAAAMTGAPVFYDARAPKPTAASDEFAIGSAAPTAEPDGAAGGAGDDEIDRPDADPPASKPTPPATRTPAPRPDASPSPTPPADPMPSEEERAAWLGFQQLVRECMLDAGYEYREWEWWTAEPRNPNSTAPAMPEGLSPDESEAWHEALEGPDGDGGGCIAEAVAEDREDAAAPPTPEPEAGPDALTPAPVPVA